MSAEVAEVGTPGGQGLDPNGAAGHTVGKLGVRARERGGRGGRHTRKFLDISCVGKGHTRKNFFAMYHA